MNRTAAQRLADAIRAANDGGGPALVAFLTAGYPRAERFARDLTAIAAAADVVEIGVPFTDPMADGVTIQRASEAALRQGVSLRWILQQLDALPRGTTPFVLMSYLNPLLAYGLDAIARDAAAVGVCGFVVPDLPFDEGAEFRTALGAHGLALVQMVTPVTTPARLAQVAAASQGFLYAVTMTGTTGRNAALAPETLEYLQRARAAARVPLCAGFGIRSHEQVEELRSYADGVIVGSALVELLERGADPAAWLRELRPQVRR
ncbi:MAG: tryptophan synthase subunit alpha [Steroidobacteraceae bacterium]|nr:tryptophan synthase subunit alpha [Steroidobacteraceae bacterium]MDW8258505.1 tryptophan synthase subunit alpha [Gammaproteobacteria bacterium]